MNLDPDIEQTRSEVLIAAAFHLLTCSAAHGMSSAKCHALVRHLGALAERSDTDPLLARTCDELADVWHRMAEALDLRKQVQAAETQAGINAGHTVCLH